MNEKAKVRKPLSRGIIFKLMVILTYVVTAAFLVKNIAGGDMQAAGVVGGALLVFTVALVAMTALKVKSEIRQLLVSSFIIVLVFIIGLTTGTYYSEDFCLYLAVIGLTGLYLKPSYGWVQLVLSDIFLAVQFVVHPDKADPLAQYVMCMATFTLAGVMFCLVIGRGRDFIVRSQIRTDEAVELVRSMNAVGQELEQNFESSSGRMESLKKANAQMKDSADLLQRSSESITAGAQDVSVSCDSVQVQLQNSEANITQLTEDVRNFEEILSTNRRNMAEMNAQMDTVKHAMDETTGVFRILDEQMHKVAAATEEINQIASNTGLLAVNASIEAARAGEAGKGFAVVATNVRELAVNSTQCSNEVADVVASMQNQIDTTSRLLTDSSEAIAASLQTLTQFQEGFGQLMEQFSSLYKNIEEQSGSVAQVNAIFTDLKDRVSEMSSNSQQNQTSVDSIARTMRLYRENIAAVIEDNRRIQELSESMLNISQTGKDEDGID